MDFRVQSDMYNDTEYYLCSTWMLGQKASAQHSFVCRWRESVDGKACDVVNSSLYELDDQYKTG